MPDDAQTGARDASGYDKESITNIFIVAVAVCLVCSIVVSTAAVALKPAQDANKALDRKRNILLAAGLIDAGQSGDAAIVNRLFEQFEVRVVDLTEGAYTDRFPDPEEFDQLRAAKNPALSRPLTEEQDIATLGRVENFATVYIKRDASGGIDTLVLPVRGYGLWGTLYGYLALKGDLETIAGLGFYEQKETPGLGGEVDNPKWKQQWVGVDAFDSQGNVAVKLVKSRTGSSHEVDALSGASLTTRGVEHLVHFWLGELGYGKYLSNLRSGGVADASLPIGVLAAAGGDI